MDKKKIAIIGAGFTGLSAGLKLAKLGLEVYIFEKDEKPGGLAIGFKDDKWSWPLEKHYHHIFTTDTDIQDLAKEVGVKILFSWPKTSMLINGKIFQLDSPISLLLFPFLSVLDRVRTGIVLFYLRILPFWKTLENITAKNFLIKSMGEKSWKVLWEPLFIGKFGKFANTIPASWFWARIKKRSASLGYPEGGFENLALKTAEEIKKNNGKIFYKTGVLSIKKDEDKFIIKTDDGKNYIFDKVISTLPSPLFIQTVKDLPQEYIGSLLNLKGIGAVNLVLVLNKSFLTDGTYWLNINDRNFPFLAIVEHTNFISPTHYNNDILLYVGNYLPQDHPYFKKTESELLAEYIPFLKLVNKDFDISWVKKSHIFKAPFAQPLIPLNYSKNLPSIKTPIKGLYLANIQQVYPWDRGTNYAVELGRKVANLSLENI